MNYKALALILMICIPFSLHANDYVVKNVRVDVTSDSAANARTKALETARMNAFNVMRDRLVPVMERGALPVINNSTVATMVDSFEINREKLSKNRYLASVNVVFNERAVQSYLGRHTNMALPDQYYGDDNNVDSAYVPGQIQPQLGESDLYKQYQQQRQVTVNATPYKMQVNLNGIRQWVNLQKSLQSVGHVQIQSLNAKKAIVILSYDGDASMLQGALNMKGLQLFSNPQGKTDYILMARGQ